MFIADAPLMVVVTFLDPAGDMRFGVNVSLY